MDIHRAAKDGDLIALRDAIKRGEDVNSVNSGGVTPLSSAAKEGHHHVFGELLSSGAEVDLADMDGWTPLWVAANEGHTDCVREFLSLGANVDLADKGGCTPLWVAASEGHTDCVKELLSSEATVNLANKKGDTPLIEAAFMGHVDTMKELLSHGASVDSTNENGETAMMIAKGLTVSKPSIIKLLEEATESHPPPQFVLVPPPKNCTAVTDTETKKPVYQNKTRTEETLYTPPGYPLLQTYAHPGVTFYDKPQEKEFTSSGGHADFDNGVEVTVPANAVPAGTSVGIKVQPSLAPKDVFVMPEGIQSASPSYLISCESLNGEVTVSMEHYVRVSTQEEADGLVWLQADSSPKRSDSKSVYVYQKVPEGSSEFPFEGNKGRLTMMFTRLKKFLKIGQTNRGATNSNLYTVRVYRSPPHTTGDRMALIIVSYFQRLFFDFLQKFEANVLPQEYPLLSTCPAHRTIKQPLRFVKVDAVLELICDPTWRSVPDQRMISQDEVDFPVIGQFLPEELYCYPPRIVCQFSPEQGAVSTTCILTLTGFDKPVSVNMELLTPQRTVDTKQLKEATEGLRRTVGEMTTSQLGSTVNSVLSLMEKLTTALQSSSLSELASHIDSIQTEIASVLQVARRVMEECKVRSISENIGASLSKIEALCHQLCLVAKFKFKHCQDLSEETETAALVDLVENGANLLRNVDCLLKTLSGFNGNAGYNVLVRCSEKIVESLSQEPKAVAVRLLSVELITERVLQETNQLNEINADKATRLFTALLGVVKHHPHKYHEFVSTLRLNPLHTDLIRELDSK